MAYYVTIATEVLTFFVWLPLLVFERSARRTRGHGATLMPARMGLKIIRFGAVFFVRLIQTLYTNCSPQVRHAECTYGNMVAIQSCKFNLSEQTQPKALYIHSSAKNL